MRTTISDKNSVANDGGSTGGVGVIVGRSVVVDEGAGVSVDSIGADVGVDGTFVEVGLHALKRTLRPMTSSDPANSFKTHLPWIRLLGEAA